MSELPYTSSSFGEKTENIGMSNKSNSGSVCTNCCENTAYTRNQVVNGAPNWKAWCAKCIEHRFSDARDNEKQYPFFKHGEVQTPRMDHYTGLFSRGYIVDWSYKTNEWTHPVENRIKCDCDAGDFIVQVEYDQSDAPFFMPCPECEKKWCVNCGDPQREPTGTPHNAPSAHSTAANPNACRDTLAAKAQQRQSQVAGLIRGTDYQLCPMCHRQTENDKDPAKVDCNGCATIFCFTCGLKHAKQDWVPGKECAWRFGPHP